MKLGVPESMVPFVLSSKESFHIRDNGDGSFRTKMVTGKYQSQRWLDFEAVGWNIYPQCIHLWTKMALFRFFKITWSSSPSFNSHTYICSFPPSYIKVPPSTCHSTFRCYADNKLVSNVLLIYGIIFPLSCSFWWNECGISTRWTLWVIIPLQLRENDKPLHKTKAPHPLGQVVWTL